jgi:hypothetical protein
MSFLFFMTADAQAQEKPAKDSYRVDRTNFLDTIFREHLLTRVWDNRPMKIDEISDGFCTKIREAGVEDAASERILVQNTPKDIDCHRVLIQNSRLLVSKHRNDRKKPE